MITQSLLQILANVFDLLLSPLPSIPDFPAELIQPMEGAQDLIHSGVGLVAYLYTPLILGVVFLVIISVLNFESIYHSIMWVVRRVRRA